MRLSERGLLVMPSAMNTSGTNTTATESVNMKGYNRCRVTFMATLSGAGGGAITLKQGSSTTASTALAFADYTASIAGTVTHTVATTATGLGSTGECWWSFEIKAEDLNTDTYGSENTYVRMNTASFSNLTACGILYELYEPIAARGSDGMPSVA